MSKIYTKEISATASNLHVDMNHDDILIVSNENIEVLWYRVKFSSLTEVGKQAANGLNIEKSVASTVSCKGSQLPMRWMVLCQFFFKTLILETGLKQTITGDILDIEMSLCMIAVKLPDKVQLYMLEQLADKSFGNKYILTKLSLQMEKEILGRN